MTDWVPRSFADHQCGDHERRHGPQPGPYTYLTVRHNGTLLNCHPTRADAVGWLTRRVNTVDGADDYEILYVPIQNVPLADLRHGPRPISRDDLTHILADATDTDYDEFTDAVDAFEVSPPHDSDWGEDGD